MTYKEKLIKALGFEGYSSEELEDQSIDQLDRLINQTMGRVRFGIMLSSWEVDESLLTTA